MGIKHKVRINVTDPETGEECVLRGADRRLPHRLIWWLFGDYTTVYLLSPGQSVKSVEVYKVKTDEGGSDHAGNK